MRTYDIIISGFGGQGVITLGNLFKLGGIKAGFRINGAERRGGAQREGGVNSHVRYRIREEGETYDERRMTRSPLIPSGKADMLIAFEPLEAVRYCNYLHPRSVVLLNTDISPPTLVRMGKYAYPPLEDLLADLRGFTPYVYPFNINELSRDYFHDFLHISVISLGLAVGVGEIPVPREKFLEVLRERFPNFSENKRGFEQGMALGLAARNDGSASAMGARTPREEE